MSFSEHLTVLPQNLEHQINIREVIKLNFENWLEDAYVQKWLKGLDENTTRGYKRNFPKWLEFIGLTPTEQIKKRLKDLRGNEIERVFFEEKVIEFKEMLETQKYEGSTIHNIHSAVQSFFSANRLKLAFARGDLKPKVTDKAKIIDKFVPTNEEIRAMYSSADVRDRALLLVAYQSGFSEADIVCLDIEHIKDVYNLENHYFIAQHRQKTDVEQATCISYEAIHEIKAMLKARGTFKLL